MPSEIRRAAKALVGDRVETFASTDAVEAAQPRVARALAELGAPRALRYAGKWTTLEDRPAYEARFMPHPHTPRVLNLLSLTLVLLVAASAWAIVAHAGALAFLVPMIAVFAVLAMPLVVTALAARREAEESRIVRAIRSALDDAR